MGSVRSESDKLRLAFKLFDSEGVSVLNMLSKGPDALDAVRDGMFTTSKGAMESAKRLKTASLVISNAFSAALDKPLDVINEIVNGINEIDSFLNRNDKNAGNEKQGKLQDKIIRMGWVEKAEEKFRPESIDDPNWTWLIVGTKHLKGFILNQEKRLAVERKLAAAVDRRSKADRKARLEMAIADKKDKDRRLAYGKSQDQRQADRVFQIQNKIRAIRDPEGAALSARQRQADRQEPNGLSFKDSNVIRALEKELALKKKISAEEDRQRSMEEKKAIRDHYENESSQAAASRRSPGGTRAHSRSHQKH